MADLKALVFDVDGTLAETEEQGHRIAFNQAFAEAGIGWHWDRETYARLLAVTGGRERIVHWCRQVDPARAAAPDFDAEARRLHAIKTRHYLARVDRGLVVLRPGVARLIQEARRSGVLLAIATTTTEINVRRLLEVTLGESAWNQFAAIGTADTVADKKPAPDIYRWVLARLNCAAGEAQALEDSAIGARSAVAAGIPTLVTRSTYTADDVLPDGLIADLAGLGEPGEPSTGTVAGQAWGGVVDLDQIGRWRVAATGEPITSSRRC
jgi:beta-phosphoglucomutase-like phosphatase (HAD superfamily)